MAAETRPSRALSVRSCRTMRPRPAPRVARSAISRRREGASPIDSPATFRQAIPRRRPAAASSKIRGEPKPSIIRRFIDSTRATCSSGSPFRETRRDCISRLATSIVRPGASRATSARQFPQSARSPPSGSHRSRRPASGPPALALRETRSDGSRKPGGSTPTTWYSVPDSSTHRPRMPGSAPKRPSHSSWLSSVAISTKWGSPR